MKLKKLFFSALSVCFLWLTSFSCANNWFENLSDYKDSSISYSDDFILRSPNTIYCVYVSWLNPTKSYSFSVNNDAWGSCGLINNSVPAWNTDYNYCFTSFSCDDSSLHNQWLQVLTMDHFPISLYKFNISNTPIDIVVDCSQDSNYRQCLEDKNVLIWQVSTLSGDLNTCNTSLSSCLNGVDVSYQACIENLSWCQSDLTNMTNYNDSLSSQLNECLAELPVPCEWTGCEETIVSDQRFSFFRENDWERFSLPVANNVFLPQGFRAYVDSWVVAIARLQDKPEISVDSETFWEVNSLFFTFFKSVIIILLFALFLRFIKTLIYPLFIPKNKE